MTAADFETRDAQTVQRPDVGFAQGDTGPEQDALISIEQVACYYHAGTQVPCRDVGHIGSAY